MHFTTNLIFQCQFLLLLWILQIHCSITRFNVKNTFLFKSMESEGALELFERSILEYIEYIYLNQSIKNSKL